MKQIAYSFLCVNRNPDNPAYEEVIRVIADSEQNARFQLPADYRLVLDRPVARVTLTQPQHFADFPQNLTHCTNHNPAQGDVYA